MKPVNLALILFCVFAIGLPILGMQNNPHPKEGACIGDCYNNWVEETGGILQIARAQAAARAEASPEELGKAAYVGCVACHGAGGEGGVGPQLAGQSATDIAGKLLRYKNGETIGGQSNLMWSQAAQLSDDDIDNLAAFIATL